jgi:hypothetical protein
MGGHMITNPFTPIPKSDKSHVRGWSEAWSQRLGAKIATKGDSISRFGNIYIDHGVNFSGPMNLFGGFNDDCVNRCKEIMNEVSKGSKLFSLDIPMNEANYVDQIEKRLGAKTTSKLVDFDFLNSLDSCLSSATTLTMDDIGLDSVILGDSHSVAYSTSRQAIKKINGKTLYSALYASLHDFIIDNNAQKYGDVTLCLGSIDIRFHSYGKDDYIESLSKAYAEQIISAQQSLGIKISPCAPVPVEHEERKLPKTGQYKGANFNGSRSERLDFTMRFIDRLMSYCCDFDVVIPPSHWYMMGGEEYAKEIMELSSSVHIAPKNYNSIIGW